VHPALDQGQAFLSRRGGGVEPAPGQVHRRLAAQVVPAGQWPLQPPGERQHRPQLGLGLVEAAQHGQRVEAPQPAPQHRVVVIVGLAEREHPVAQSEPFGDPVRARAGHLP